MPNPDGRPPSVFVSPSQRFGRLVVIDPETRTTPRPSKPNGARGALCRCDCGAETTVNLVALISATTQSCGCLKEDRDRTVGAATLAAVVKSHGLTRHPLYQTWHDMLRRCEDRQAKSYADYGGRGIRVCAEWHDVATFITWIETNLGPRAAGMTLDRIDNNGHYEPGNVQWATRVQQAANRRKPANRSASAAG